MRTVNPNIFPKTEGYVFTESDGARIFGGNWEGVIARVTVYRRRAGYPPGNPRVEVMAQACAKNPGACIEDNAAEHAAQLRKTPLRARVLTWLNAQRGRKDRQLVEDGLARSRAGICAKCPKNQPMAGGCASCAAALKELRSEILDRRLIDGRLNGCDVLGEDLPTAIHLELQTVENSELPGECWRKRTL